MATPSGSSGSLREAQDNLARRASGADVLVHAMEPAAIQRRFEGLSTDSAVDGRFHPSMIEPATTFPASAGCRACEAGVLVRFSPSAATEEDVFGRSVNSPYNKQPRHFEARALPGQFGNVVAAWDRAASPNGASREDTAAAHCYAVPLFGRFQISHTRSCRYETRRHLRERLAKSMRSTPRLFHRSRVPIRPRRR